MASAEGFDRSSLTDKVYTLLKGRILSQTLEPGQKVEVDQVATELGISRTPVKDALHRLTSDGLVVVLPRRGTFVARLDLTDLLELLDVRMALETYAVAAAVERVTPEQLREVRTLVESLEVDYPADPRIHGEYDEFLARDRRFHLLLVSLAGNRKLVEYCENLHVEIQVARAYYRSGNLETDRVHAEHRAVLEAFERRDAEGAVQAIEYHLGRVRHSLLKGLAVSGGHRQMLSIQ